MAAVHTRLVGVLPIGRESPPDLPPGGMDSPAHSEVLLAAVARARRSGAQIAQPGLAGTHAQGGGELSGAWHIARTGSIQTALSNATLFRHGFLMVSDLAVCY